MKFFSARLPRKTVWEASGKPDKKQEPTRVRPRVTGSHSLRPSASAQHRAPNASSNSSTARAWARYLVAAFGSLTVSPWKSARPLLSDSVSRDLLGESKAPNLDHRQIGEAALIRAETIGRTEPHPEIAMKDRAERFPTVVTSHGFSMRQTSLLALHLRSPFPRLRITNAKALGGFQISPGEEKRSPSRKLSNKCFRAPGTRGDLCALSDKLVCSFRQETLLPRFSSS
jgi:hypothetical protein